MKLKGIVEVWSLDKEGKVKSYIKKSNTILNSGREGVFKNNDPRIYKIGIGSDNTDPDPSQTGLLNEVRRENGSKSTEGDYSVKIEHTFTDFTEAVDICEAGVVCENVGYLNRVTFDPVTCDENNNIKIRFTITVTD